MACGYNANCWRIANSIYPSLKDEISGSINATNKDINGIVDELSSLQIPDDYLGEKVKSKIEDICLNLNNDSKDIKAINGNIDGFIESKILEHQGHYNDWKIEEDRKIKEKNSQVEIN